MKFSTQLTDLLGIDYPMIMAPMFLVSNEKMIKSAIDEGIAGAFPTLNFREEKDLEEMLRNCSLHQSSSAANGTFGVNLIVQKSNPFYKKHLKLCVQYEVPFYITSLGNPKEVIEEAHKYGAKVFCDVTNIEHARKAYDMGCDGFIAVGQGAGGHAGPNPLHILIPSLLKEFPDKPVVGAGGIANGIGVASVLALGGAGVSVGTRFIATQEAGVNDAYKNAIVSSKMSDIVMTTKISGTPCTIINTPYAKKIGYKQNFIERYLSKNKTTRKYFKMWVQYIGMKKMEQSVLPANYKTLWCAGQSVELIDSIDTIKDIVNAFKEETKTALDNLYNRIVR